MIQRFAALLLILGMSISSGYAGDLTRGVRYKLSAGDLESGIAAVDEYRLTTGVDAEYLDALGWLARGAEMLHRDALAETFVSEIRRAVPAETPELVIPFGAAIEVKAKLLVRTAGRGAALRFLRQERARAADVALQSRIEKNLNLLELEGMSAPEFTSGVALVGAMPAVTSLHGKPALLFFWRHDCGDCKAQSATLARVWSAYRDRVAMIAVTRLYGSLDDKPATAEEETAQAQKVWRDVYPALAGVPSFISTETMVRYGASATPTIALLGRSGVVRLYAPTRLSEAELTRRIDELLAETP